MPTQDFQSQLIMFGLRDVTEAAARAVAKLIGRGEPAAINAAAVTAMRGQLARLPLHGLIAIEEGLKEQGAGFAEGEEVGDPKAELQMDIATDPVEGTSYVAKGMTNAMAVIAMAPRGTMFRPGPAFYMEKLAVSAPARGKVDPVAPVEDKLAALSRALGKPVKELTVYVLEKPRHRPLIARIQKAGARVALYPAGDIAGAIMAAIPNSGIDALMGTGGSPEGVISACAIRGLGGEFYGRLDPQLPSEHIAVREAGLDVQKWRSVDELVTSTCLYFAATGITTGLLLDGVEKTRHHERTQTLLISSITGERHLLTTYHPLDPDGSGAGRGDDPDHDEEAADAS